MKEWFIDFVNPETGHTDAVIVKAETRPAAIAEFQTKYSCSDIMEIRAWREKNECSGS